jgi:hypothetical protein
MWLRCLKAPSGAVTLKSIGTPRSVWAIVSLLSGRCDILYARPRTCSSRALAFSLLFFGETTRGSFLQTSELISAYVFVSKGTNSLLGIDVDHDDLGRDGHQALELGGETNEVWSRIFDNEGSVSLKVSYAHC